MGSYAHISVFVIIMVMRYLDKSRYASEWLREKEPKGNKRTRTRCSLVISEEVQRAEAISVGRNKNKSSRKARIVKGSMKREGETMR